MLGMVCMVRHAKKMLFGSDDSARYSLAGFEIVINGLGRFTTIIHWYTYDCTDQTYYYMKRTLTMIDI